MNKCSSETWDKLLKESKENNNIECDESFESNESIGEEELKFIQESNKEYIKKLTIYFKIILSLIKFYNYKIFYTAFIIFTYFLLFIKIKMLLDVIFNLYKFLDIKLFTILIFEYF